MEALIRNAGQQNLMGGIRYESLCRWTSPRCFDFVEFNFINNNTQLAFPAFNAMRKIKTRMLAHSAHCELLRFAVF